MTAPAGIALCAIVKDEESYLPEWLVYHQVVGISHFYLWDNESRVSLVKLAKALPGISISVIPIGGKGRQMDAYTECLKTARGRHKWVAFLDADEFLVPCKSWTLTDALRPYDPFGGVGVNWQTFGSSGHEKRPPGLQMESFLRKTPLAWSWNKHVKSIVQPERTERARGPHHFDYKSPWFCVNEASKKTASPFSEPVSCDVLQVNHYFTRSRAEFSEKVKRGAGDGTAKTMTFFDLVDREAVETDRLILRFAPAVKSILKDVEKSLPRG